MTKRPPPQVQAYLDTIPDEHLELVRRLRETIVENLPEGYNEAMAWGMLTYLVPLERTGPTYNGKPLMYAALASQKRHVSLYLTAVYADPARAERFRERYLATGREPDMGSSCVRFRRLDDVPLELIGETIAAAPVDEFLALEAAARGAR